MNGTFTASTSDVVGETDQPPDIRPVDFLAALAAGPRALVLLETFVLGGEAVRLDLAALSRASGASRSALSRAKSSLIRSGVLSKEADGSVSLQPYREWPEIKARPKLLDWLARPADDIQPTDDDT